MANELEVKEITELDNITPTDEALVLVYNETEGVGKTSFQNAKKYLGAEIHAENTATTTANGGTNKVKISTRNGMSNAEITLNVKNGEGINSITQSESTDENGLRSNAIAITASETKNSVSATIKDGVGVKAHSVTPATDKNGLKSNTLSVSYTNGTSDSIKINDGVGVKSAQQTTSSTLSGEKNEYTITLTDGSSSKIQVYNGRAGKDFRIKKTYSSVAAMNEDFSGTDVSTYEFCMIDTGSVEDADTGKLYCKGETAWNYIGDLSGRQGIKGETGNGIATVTNKQNSAGNIDITFTMTDGTSKTVTVLNGTNVRAGANINISDDYIISADLSSKQDKLTLPLAASLGGTGKTTLKDAGNAIINSLDNGTATPLDSDYYIVHSGTAGKRNHLSLWNYINSKIAMTDSDFDDIF